MDLTNRILRDGSLIHIHFRNECEVQGYVSSLSDNLLSIKRDGDEMPYVITEEELDQVKIMSILPPAPNQIIFVPLEVNSDTIISNVYSRSSGYITGGDRGFMFSNDSDFSDQNLLDVLHGNNMQQLEGSRVICAYSKELQRRYIIGHRSVDELLDFIAEKAKDGDVFMANAFLEVLMKQLPEDLDVISFKRELQSAIDKMVIDINAPIHSDSKLFLDAMGYITSFDKGNGIGVIYDQRSHKELWFHEMQLIDPDLKDKNGNIDINSLIGSKVLYYIKPKQMGIRHFEARSIIMPMERYKALDLAQELYPQYKMNLSAWSLLKAVQYQKEIDSELEDLITQFEYNSYIRKNKWTFDKLPQYEGPIEKKLLYLNRNFSLNLRRTGIHQIQKSIKEDISANLIPEGNELSNLFQAEEEKRKQRQRELEELNDNNIKLKEDNNNLIKQIESLEAKMKQAEESADEYKNKYLNLNDRYDALKEKIDSDKSGLTWIHEDTNDVLLEPYGRIVRYDAIKGHGTMEIFKTNKNGEILKDSTSLPIPESKSYYFTIDDIYDPQLEEQATVQSPNNERLKGIRVLCYVSTDNYKATSICACNSFFDALRTVRRLYEDNKVSQAQSILNLIARRQPSRPEVTSLQRLLRGENVPEIETPGGSNLTTEEDTELKEINEVPDFFKEAEVFDKEGHQIEAIGAYQEAYYKLQKDKKELARKCICRIISLYHNLLESTSEAEKEDIKKDYNNYGKSFLARLDQRELSDVSAKMMYYKDFHNDELYLKMLKRKAELFGEKGDKVQQADCLASLAQRFLMIGKLKEASEHAQMAYRADNSNPVAIACNSFFYYNDKNKFNPTVPSLLEVEPQKEGLSINLPDFEYTYGNIPKDSTLSQIQMWLHYDIATNKSSTALDKSIFKLTYSFLASDISDFKSKTATHSLESSQSLYFTFLYLTRIWIEPVREDPWEPIMLAMALSSEAAAKLSDYLFVINEDKFRKLLAQFGHPTRDKARKQLCINEVRKWRKEILTKYNKWILMAQELKDENSPESFSSFLSHLEPCKWMTPRDKEYISGIQKEIPELIMQFVNAKSSRDIIQNYEELNQVLKYKIDDCSERPTLLLEASILPILKKLQISIKRLYGQKNFTKPIPKVAIISIGDYNDNGDFIIDFEICNSNKMSYPILSLSIQFASNKVISWPEKESLFSSYEDLYGGETLSFSMHARLNDKKEDGMQTKLSYTLSWSDELEAQLTSKGNLNLCFHKDQKRTVENYYKGFGSPVSDANMFFGRQKYIDDIFSSVMNGYQFVIYGQKRSGKTSLLNIIHRELDKRSSIGQYFSIQVSFGQAATESECYNIILAAISNELTKLKREWKRHKINIEEIPELQIPKEYVFHEKPVNIHILMYYLKELKQTLRETKGWEKCQEIFFIDEFTSVFKYIKTGAIGSNFVESWKMMQQDVDANFTSILVGQDSFIKFAKEYGGTRNAFGIIHQQRLTYLNYSEARQFVLEPTLRAMKGTEEEVFAKGAIDRILYYSGCSTYFTMGLCKYLIDFVNLNRLRKITVTSVDEAAFLFAKSTDFETIGVDALTMSGETDAVSDFNSNQTECILNYISQFETQKRGCPYDLIVKEFEPKNYTVSFIDQILKDLDTREVITCYNDKYYKVKVKLYIKRYYYKWNNQNFTIPQMVAFS